MSRRAPILLFSLLLLFSGCAHLSQITSFSPPEPEILWGYTREHPLPMPSVLTSVEYIDRLRNPDGSLTHWRRIGAEHIPHTPDPEHCVHRSRMDRIRDWLGIKRTPGTILDRYEFSTPSGPVTLWINPYAGRYPPEPPKGFSLIQ